MAELPLEHTHTHTPGRGGWSRRRGQRSEGTHALSGAHRTATAPRAAPPLWGPELAGLRRRSSAPLTHLRVQWHQLHERPGLLELSKRHRAAAGPLALLRRPGPPPPGSRDTRLQAPACPRPPPDPCAPAGPSAAATAAAAVLTLRLPPSLGAAAPIGYLSGGAGPQKPRPIPRSAAFPERIPASAAQGALAPSPPRSQGPHFAPPKRSPLAPPSQTLSPPPPLRVGQRPC